MTAATAHTFTGTRETKTARTGTVTYVHTVTMDGEVIHTRKSKTREYEFAVVSLNHPDGPGVLACSGDRANAEKAANTWRNYGHKVVIVQLDPIA